MSVKPWPRGGGKRTPTARSFPGAVAWTRHKAGAVRLHTDAHDTGRDCSPGPEEDSPTGGLARTAALLGGFALASRLLGLARDMCMAWLLGGGAAADALVAAMRLPHVLRRLLGEGSLSMTMTACLVRLARQPQDSAKRDMRALSAALALRLGALLGALTLLGLLAAPWITGLLAPGFSGPQREAAVELMRVCLPYVPAAVMAALGMAFLHSLGIFWLPAFSPVLFNLVLLAFAGVAGLGLLPPAFALAMGMTCGGVAQWLAQWLAVRRLLPGALKAPGSAERAGGRSRTARMAWGCLRRIPAGLLGASAPQLAMLAAMALASGLGQGQVSALYYAERLLELPLGLVGVCLGMASLPTLSRLAARGETARFEEQLAAALRLTLLLILPAAAGLWAVGPRLIEGLFSHGAFDDRAAYETGMALWAYLPGLPAFAVNRPLLSACNALGAARRTAVSSVGSVAVTLVAGMVLMRSLSGGVGVMAPALAVSLGLWTQTGLLLRILGGALRAAGGTGSEERRWLPRPAQVLRQALAALAACLAAWLLLELLHARGLWTGLVCAVASGAAAWCTCLWVLRDGDFLALVRTVCRLKPGRHA